MFVIAKIAQRDARSPSPHYPSARVLLASTKALELGVFINEHGLFDDRLRNHQWMEWRDSAERRAMERD